jgi:hypothetical protein
MDEGRGMGETGKRVTVSGLGFRFGFTILGYPILRIAEWG